MRRHRFDAAAPLAAVLAAALLLLPACGGGGGGGGGTAPPPPMTSLAFSPAGAASGPSLLLRRQGTGTQTLELEVAAQDVDGLYGLFFDLGYPAAVLSFEGATEGDFLSSGGNPTAFQVAEQEGRLVVGITRLGQASGRSGSGVVMTLRFRALASGSGALGFSRNQAQASGGDVLDVGWIGGSVQANL